MRSTRRLFSLIVVMAVVLLSVWGLYSQFSDRVQLNGVAGSMPATVIIDGRRSGCFEDQKANGQSPLFWNVLSRQACHSEIIAFAEGSAMNVQTEVTAWTDSPADVLPVQMAPELVVPINLFIMSGDFDTHDEAKREAQAKNDVARATQIYGAGQCGIAFSVGLIKDERTAPNVTPALLTAECTGNVASFNAIDPIETAKPGVKIFYVDGPSGLQGQTCADGQTAVIIITVSSTNETLAHELGHAFSLGHANNPTLKMPADNLMMSPASNPGALTLGQCYRTNINQASVVNTSGFRMGLKRTCTDDADDSECLVLSFKK
jgi:hypothetical protein